MSRKQAKRARFAFWQKRARRDKAVQLQLSLDLLLCGSAFSKRVDGRLVRIAPEDVYITTSAGRVSGFVEIR